MGVLSFWCLCIFPLTTAPPANAAALRDRYCALSLLPFPRHCTPCRHHQLHVLVRVGLLLRVLPLLLPQEDLGALQLPLLRRHGDGHRRHGHHPLLRCHCKHTPPGTTPSLSPSMAVGLIGTGRGLGLGLEQGRLLQSLSVRRATPCPASESGQLGWHGTGMSTGAGSSSSPSEFTAHNAPITIHMHVHGARLKIGGWHPRGCLQCTIHDSRSTTHSRTYPPALT